MKREELEKFNLTKEVVDEIMQMNGDDIENSKKESKKEIDTLREQLKTVNGSLADVQEKLKDVDSKDETINKLQKQMEDYINAENVRKEKEKAEKADRELTERISAVFPTDKEFTSEYVRNGIISDIKAKMKEDNTLGVKEIFESLTTDKEGIFKNAQQQRLNIPSVDVGDGSSITKDDLKRMTPEEINKNWKAITDSGMLGK